MPIVQIALLEGRPPEKKHKLLTAVSGAVAESLEIPIDRVRVYLVEMSKDQLAIGGVPVAQMEEELKV